MNLSEIKEKIRLLSSSERLELLRFLFELERREESRFQAEVNRRMKAMDAGQKVPGEIVEAIHRQLLAHGL